MNSFIKNISFLIVYFSEKLDTMKNTCEQEMKLYKCRKHDFTLISPQHIHCYFNNALIAWLCWLCCSHHRLSFNTFTLNCYWFKHNTFTGALAMVGICHLYMHCIKSFHLNICVYVTSIYLSPYEFLSSHMIVNLHVAVFIMLSKYILYIYIYSVTPINKSEKFNLSRKIWKCQISPKRLTTD